MLYRRRIARTGLTAGILFTAALFGLAPAALAVTPPTAVPPLILSGRQSTRPAGTYSPGVTEIIKLLDAKVDAQVVLAYIQNSTVPYDPEASELIALKEHGASTETLVALLHRGDELRLQLAQAQSASTPPPIAPAYENPAEAAYPPPAYNEPEAANAPVPGSDYSNAAIWPSAYWISGYGPYWHAHGRYYPRGGYGRPVGDGGRQKWASGARPIPDTPTPPSVSAPSSPSPVPVVAHSNGLRGSGHSGGRSGGRSR